MMRSVPGRVSSPAFIGRRVQLDALRGALADLDREPRRVVLVHGEAGIGKTRLLDEFSRSVSEQPVGDRPIRVLRGTCVELGGGELPYAPILDILDALAKDSAIPGESAAIQSLRDELGGAGPSERISSGRGRIFVGIRDLLVSAAGTADVIVCIDDLHWADRSTLELLSFLSTRVAAARVLFVFAYRSDEIHRHHPLRPVLAELERGVVAADISLESLGHADVRDQLGAILGAPADGPRFERIVALADGNPFHVEELAVLDLDARALPRSLRDVLLARLDRLDDAVLDLLGTAAVIGRDVDEGLLAAVAHVPEGDVRAALRQAIEHHVIEPAPDGRRHRFRHALLREAVLGDLLPSERIGLHRQIGEALEARPELAASSPAAAAAELAYHWSEAGDTVRAFPALVEAGRRAQAAHAWTEASDAFERAATLARAGAGPLEAIDRAELLMRSAWLANFAGDLRRGLALARAAVAADDGVDPRRSGALLTWLGSLASDAGEFELAVPANERAVELIPADPPSVERALAVDGLAGRRMIANRCLEAIELVDEAIAFYRAADAPGRLGKALGCRAMSTSALGRVEETRAAVDESMGIFADLGDDWAYEAAGMAMNDAFALYVIGDFDRVPTIVDEAMARATALGSERGWAIWLEPSAAIAAFVTGDWRAAAERLDRFRGDAEAGFPLLDTVFMDAQLAAGRGDRARVTALGSNVDVPTHDWYAGQFARLSAVAALWDGDARAAAAEAESALSAMSGQEEFPSLVEILKTAVQAYSGLAERHRASRAPADAEAATGRAAELARDAASLAAGTYLAGASSTPWMRAVAVQVGAEAERAAGRSDPATWGAAATAHAEVGTVPDVAYCRYRQAEALLVRGDSIAAGVALREAHAIALRVGMTPLVGWVETMARRARLQLDVPPDAQDRTLPNAPPDPWGLSQREREVLALLGQGHTNRQIGEVLFISGKTASVHVTHILDKMGVSSRTEAALLDGRSAMTIADGQAGPVGD
jgi:DNA-binding CsgD family transcriptional regulator/tetratricopeptide (TPR) repeat protein